MKDFNYKLWFWIAVIAIAILAILWFSDRTSSGAKFDVTNKALQISENKFHQQVVTSSLYLEKYQNLMAVDAGKDSLLIRMKKDADKNLQIAIAMNTQTTSHHQGPTSVVFAVGDTVMTDSGSSVPCDSVFPEYRYNERTEDDTVSVIANRNQTIVNYSVYNNFDIKQSWKRKGLFGKEYFVQVTNRNPHTVTLDMRAFKLDVQKPRRIVWLFSGIVVGAAGMIYLSK